MTMTQQETVEAVELARWRAFGRRLDYLRSYMAAGELAMLVALLANDNGVLRGLDLYVDELSRGR